jgi:multiple sugar transport system permease protein
MSETTATAPTVVDPAVAPRGPRRAPPRSADQRRAARARWTMYGLLILGMVLVAGPFLWMVLGSVKTQSELLQLPPTWWPEAPTLANYERLFERLNFPRFFFNSTVVAVAITGGNLVFCSMIGYALAKLDFAGRNKLFLLVMATLMVPQGVIIVPLFILMANLGLVDTHAGLILPFAAGAFGVFLMRQFMMGIPDELLEAARVDGATEWYLFWRIVMPLSGPALATLGILTFMSSWNMFTWPLVVATSENMYTLPVALATFSRGQFSSDYGLLMAGSLVIVLPILIVFMVLQKHFTQGIATTGLKG